MHKSALTHHIKNHHDTPIPPGSIIPTDRAPPPVPYGQMRAPPHLHPQMSHLPPPPPLQRMQNPSIQQVINI